MYIMTKKGFFLTVLFLFIASVQAQDANLDYIRTHARLAVEEMHLYKIPASITLAQGILETGGGQSRLAEIANNHFGIKCKSEWKGDVISHTDDAPNECFRKYNSVQESYRDHSLFLAERPYYKALFTLDMYDYSAWAHGLKKAGYATNPKYAGILISRIEKYKLDQFDRLTPEQVDKKLNELYGLTHIIALSGIEPSREVAIETEKDEILVAVHTPKQETKNSQRVDNEKSSRKNETVNVKLSPAKRIKNHAVGVSYVEVYEGETIKSIAELYNIRPVRLASYNELSMNSKLTPGQYLFFDKKKNKGAYASYKVKQGDNLYLISQKTGIKMRNLNRLNNLKTGEQPKVGSTLNLKKRKKRR